MNHSISTMTGKTKIKIVFLGSQSVGKSSIIEKYIHDRFEETANPTVGIDFLAKNISHKAKNYRLQLWDTAGQQRFRSLIPSYLKDAHSALIIFDVTNKNTLGQAEMWVNLFNENKGGEGFTFLIGNKIDLDYREVTTKQGQEKASKLGIPYFEISAKTGQNVEQLFLKLVDVCSQKSLSAANFSIDKKQEVIKQQQLNKQEQNQVATDPNNTDAKVKQQKQQASTNVVLKNEKVNNKQNKKKSCC